MDFSDSSTFSTASGKDYHYVVLQVTLKEKFLGTGSGNLTELEEAINHQAQKGYRLHTITTSNGGSKGLMGGDRIQATMVFEKVILQSKNRSFERFFCYLSANRNQNFGPISVFSAPQVKPCRSNTVFAMDSPSPSPFALRDGSA